VWEITHAALDALIQRNPRMAYDLMQLVSMRLTEAQAAMFADLQERNRQLSQAYQDLLAAQEQLVEKERLERELQVASEIQMSILPRELLKVPGYDFGARILPARAVGGDFFDVFKVGDRKIAFVIGDVAGKGVPAAIYMARVHAFLAAEAAHCSSAAEALRRVNHHLIQVDQNSMFVTVILGLVDLETGQVSYARGGHELPVVVQPGGPPELADWEDGQILGILEDLQLDEQTISLPPGGMLLLYTDGLIDGRSPQGESFGYDRLMEEADRMAGIPAQEACDRLLERLMAFQDTEAQFDDVTLLALVVQ
jgi:phosphoserine phosphatase RsbU/P